MKKADLQDEIAHDALDFFPNGDSELNQEKFYQTFFLFLLEAKRQAEQENKAKSDFVALVSHEIRMPLSSMLGMMQLLKQAFFDPEQQKVINDILQAGERLLSLVNGLLDMSKLEAGKMELSDEPLDIKELVNEVGTIIAYNLAEKPVELIVDCDRQVPGQVLGDKRALYQILLNLASNAGRFTDTGFVAIRVRLLVQPLEQLKDNTTVTLSFSIEDTGIGISASQLKRLFNRFEQASGPQGRGGTGLGLSISKSYVEQMGGKISVTSRVNEGSTFTVTIPFKLAREESPRLGVQCESIPYGEGNIKLIPALQGLRILLVEDDDLICKVHTSMLTQLGCLVVRAKNAQEAFRQSVAQVYDCIFVDIGLPDFSGYEVVTEIKQAEGPNQKTPIIGLTAYQDKESLDHALAVGMNDVLTKPVKSGFLKYVLMRQITSLHSEKPTSPGGE